MLRRIRNQLGYELKSNASIRFTGGQLRSSLYMHTSRDETNRQ